LHQLSHQAWPTKTPSTAQEDWSGNVRNSQGHQTLDVIRDAQNHTVQPLQVIFHIKVWVSIGLPFPAESTWSSGHVGPFNICSILKQPAPRAAATPAALKQDCARNGGGPGFRTTQHNKMNINEPQ